MEKLTKWLFSMKITLNYIKFHGKMDRIDFTKRTDQAFKATPVVALLGPRQCGKTTLANAYLQKANDFAIENYFDLEDAVSLERLQEPQQTLSELEGLIVIDEIQETPELFRTLRVLADNPQLKQRYLILGSASRTLLRQSSESLAGRISYIELTPFSGTETHETDALWVRGGFPRSYLAADENISSDWRKNYIKTFLESDIPKLGINIPAAQLRRFWMMLTHYHGQTFNASEIARSLQISKKNVGHYLDILEGTFMIRRLPAWYENMSKRQVKAPKIYFRDSGIYHTLGNLNSRSELLTSPKLGASWEGFALEEVIRHHQVDPEDCYFWATHNQAELDLLMHYKGKRLGFEFKYVDAPKTTKSMRIAMEDLKLDGLIVIYPGNIDYKLESNITVYGLMSYLEKEPK